MRNPNFINTSQNFQKTTSQIYLGESAAKVDQQTCGVQGCLLHGALGCVPFVNWYFVTKNRGIIRDKMGIPVKIPYIIKIFRAQNAK